MMKTLKLTTVMMLILSTSCARSQRLEFYGETVTVDYPKQVDALKGYSVALEGEYTGFMCAYDGMLVFESEQHPDGWLYLYDAETGKRINAIVKRGKGPNEFVNPSFFGNFEINSNEVYFWINDHAKQALMLLNMQGECVKEIDKSKFKSTNPYGIGSFDVLNDSLLLAYVQPMRIFEKENTYSPPGQYVFNYKRGKIVKKHIAFSEYEEREDVIGLYPGLYLASFGAIKPDKTKYVTALYSLKRVNILDLESGKMKSIATKDAPDLNYLSFTDSIKDYYRFVVCDDHYIYVLEHVEGAAPGRIYVFDWDGNFVRMLCIDEGDICLAFDPVRKILYSKNDAEEITAYDLKYLYK